jgi:hypothetical protein
MMKIPSGVREFRDIDAYVVCWAMRDNEREQNAAYHGGEYDHELAAREIIAKGGVRYTLADASDCAVLIGGFTPAGDGRWNSWQAGTCAAWEKHWRAATKASRWLMDEIFQNGARRIVDTPLMCRTAAIEWITRSMGFKLEGVMRQFGANGEDVGLYAITADDYFSRHARREQAHG